MPDRIDVIIIGGGVAGTSLAWTLYESGKSFLLIDDCRDSTASRIAAGLITPITGKRLNETYQWSSAFRISDTFYRTVEERLQSQIWYRSGSARLLDPADKIEEVRERLAQFPEIQTAWLEPSWFDSNLMKNAGGFFMSEATRLDIQRYLADSHRYFQSKGMYHQAWVDLDEDIFLYTQNVFYRPSNITADYVICCRGIADRDHRYFQKARFNPAQGDILRIRFAQPIDNTTLHSGWWLTPAKAFETVGCLDVTTRPKSNEWLLGSTYQWRPLDGIPNPSGRDSLIEGLQQRLAIQCDVLDHHAAVRPASFDQKPMIGMHPDLPRLGMLNGLGAKGCYLAPWCASLMVKSLFDQQAVPKELLWYRK